MADQDGLRKRGQNSKQSPTSQSLQGNTTSSKRRQTAGSVGIRALLAFVLAGAVFVAFQNFGLVQQFVTGGRERSPLRGPLPGTTYKPNVSFSADEAKKDAVVKAFQHAWLAYERDAMGSDEYHPISQTGSNLTEAGGIGYTVVDSMDTMVIMGLDDEYQRARKWVEEKLSFDRDGNFNTFETTIRVLGGLLSTYHLTEDPLYLEKAKDLADRLLPSFDTKAGLPLPMTNLAQRKGVPDQWSPQMVSTAEISTLQLELKYLSELTGNEVYWEHAEHVMKVIKGGHLPNGLAAIFMDHESGRFTLSAIRLGSRGDSYYEYLLKQWLQTNREENVYREMYEGAMTGIATHLLSRTEKENLVYTLELVPQRGPTGEVQWALVPKQDHLVCFLGGSLMLGAVTSGALVSSASIPPRAEELSEAGRRDWINGVALIETCMKTHETMTGLSPEIAHFKHPAEKASHPPTQRDWFIKGAYPPGGQTPYDARYILRPETVESLFIAYRLTGDERYRDYGWGIFESIEKHCRIESGGYASILNVDELPVEYDDKMDTFLMSETLKYLYLLFEDDTVLPLSKYVFNTEAHPLPIFTPSIRTGFS